MAESPQQHLALAPPQVLAWVTNKPMKKSPQDYVALQEKYAPSENP